MTGVARTSAFSQGYLSLVLARSRVPSQGLVDALIVCLRIHLPDLFTADEPQALTAETPKPA